MALRFTAGSTSTAGQYSWWLYGANGELVAWAGETFPTSSNAERAAREFKSGAATARYDVYADLSGQYRWRAWRSSDKVAASGEAFASRSNAERAYQNVQANAGSASGV